jgi:hypothetical protein
MTLSMKSLAVIAFVVLLVAVTLAVLLPSVSWAASSFYDWFTHPVASPCACVGGN